MSHQPPDQPSGALPSSPLPTGTVTFLFTDIEDSTPLVQQLGERYAQVQRDHQALLRAVWAAHAGVEVDTQGDSFFVAFTRATDALAAAIEAQQALAAHGWPAGAQVRVRMGMHTGSGVLASPRQYIGLDVIRAARIAAAGHGGQILLSQATRDQVAKELVAGAGLRDLGRHRLKGLTRREEIYQLVLPGMPADYPPLKTLDAWPGYRADLVAVILIGAPLLAAAGLALPTFVPGFPQGIGLGAAVLAGFLVLSTVLARPVRRALLGQWRDARKPVAAATSVLLTLVVVTTTLFVTKPPIVIRPAPYIFDYTYHAPTRTGGAITVGLAFPLETLMPAQLTGKNQFIPYLGLWQNCLTQLPNASLGLTSYQPDQCQEVPTIANRLESLDGRTTSFRIDPRAVWSDGVPITADDFLFAQRLLADSNMCDCAPFTLMHLTAPDAHTVQIHWPVQYGDYLAALAQFQPVPLHVYATGKFAGVYDPRTGAYDSDLAQAMVASPNYDFTYPVVNGPFTVHSFVPQDYAVLVRNPRFFSNYFHTPALDQVTLVSAAKDFPAREVQAKAVTFAQLSDAILADYRKGGLEGAEGVGLGTVSRLSGIPSSEEIISPNQSFIQFAFNQRGVAPNARANGGISIFADPAVRKAFVEAYDRCDAVRALLHLHTCLDPNLFSDELTAPPAPDYDPTFKLPAYDPAAAAAALDRAGYRVVDGFRRYKDGTTPLELNLAVSFTATDSIILAERMQQDYLKNLHVGVTITTKVNANAPSSAYQMGDYDLALFFRAIPTDPVGNLLSQGSGWDAADIPSAQNPGGGNFLGIIDDYVVAQDRFGTQVLDADQRAAVYRSLQRYVSGLLDIVSVHNVVDVSLVKPTLCNYKQSPEGNLWNMADWYVAPSCP